MREKKNVNNAKIVYKTNHSPTTSFVLRRSYHRKKKEENTTREKKRTNSTKKEEEEEIREKNCEQVHTQILFGWFCLFVF